MVGPGAVITPAVVALLAGRRAWTGSRSIAGRASRSSPPATRSAGRACRSDRPASPTPTARGSRRSSRRPARRPSRLGIALDRLDDVRARLRAGLEAGVDAIIVSGGVSVGPYDVVRDGVRGVRLHRPLAGRGPAGQAVRVRDRAAGRRSAPILLFGLPGNPVSTFVTFELFVRPALRRLAGRRDDDLHRAVDRAVLTGPVSKSPGRRGYQRVIAERDAAGAPVRDAQGRVPVRLAGGQGSHVISALAAADALAVIPEAHDELPAGAEVELWWLDRA